MFRWLPYIPVLQKRSNEVKKPVVIERKNMKISQNGLNIIKQFEGLVLHAYKDPGSKNGLPITIGYGSTTHLDGSTIKLGEVISKDLAERMLEQEANNKARVINNLNLDFNQNQFDSLVSFVYNIGAGSTKPPSGFLGSTLLKKAKLNVNDPSIRTEFNKWTHNDGKVLDALVRRRKQEADLYFS